MARDIRISTEVDDTVGHAMAETMRDGPEPARYECVICGGQGDADSEATSIVVYQYPEFLNIVYGHAACTPSVVEQRAGIDLATLYRTHVTSLLITDPDGSGWPVLVVEPPYPIKVVAPGSADGTNPHVSAWLGEGLALMGMPPEIPPPPADGWRVVLVPGDDDGSQVRVTIQCRVGSAGPSVDTGRSRSCLRGGLTGFPRVGLIAASAARKKRVPGPRVHRLPPGVGLIAATAPRRDVRLASCSGSPGVGLIAAG